MDEAAVALAGRAAELSTSLYSLGESCGHDETSSDISNIAGELALLSTTLWRLQEAMTANKDSYTTAFNADLDEIILELTLLFDEIGECCVEMQKMDTPGAVGWFFKKGRVSKLQKHLEALKTTLVVMRTVLHHGKEYGIQNSPGRLAESAPHTMFEDRAILESVFAKNRNAIMDLHNLEKGRSHAYTSSTSSAADTSARISKTSSDENYLPGSHGRNLSNATGVEVPPIPDVLPSKPEKRDKPATDTLSRRFSKRGVRLGVHMSILDLGAHDAATSLRKKWIAQANAQARSGDNEHHHMSTIAEGSTQAEESKDREPPVSADDRAAPTNGVGTPPRRGDSGESGSKGRSRANSLISSPIGKAVSKAIRRLSLSNVRHGRRGNEAQSGNVPSSEGSSNGTGGDGSDETGAEHGHGGGGGIKKQFALQKDKLEAHLTKPELSTPDYNQEFENGRW